MSETSKNKRKVEMTNPEPANSLKPKERWEIWLGLSNLVLTVIIGVGVAVFLNYRNEKIQLEIIQLQANINRQLSEQQTEAQKELLELQVENERKAKIANIEVTEVCAYFWGCDGTLQVRNLGPAEATNLKIVLYSPNINEAWLPIMQDISAFSVRIPTPLIDYTITQTTVDSLSSSNLPAPINAFEIDIKKLKVDETFLIITKPSPTLPLEHFEITKRVVVHKSAEYLFYIDALREYMNRQFTVATFSIDLDCGNCVTTTTPGWVNVSSLEYWSSTPTSQLETVHELDVPITYFMPEILHHVPDSSVLELDVTVEYGAVVFKPTSP